MTTGTSVTGPRQAYTPNPFQGETFIGTQITKVWSGGDNPPGVTKVKKGYFKEPFTVRRVKRGYTTWVLLVNSTNRLFRTKKRPPWYKLSSPTRKAVWSLVDTEVTPDEIQEIRKYRWVRNPAGHGIYGAPRYTPHPYSMSLRVVTNGLGLVTDYNNVGPFDDPVVYSSTSVQSVGAAGRDYIDNWSPNDELLLIAKLGNEIRGSGFNLGVFLAEAGQSLSMIFNAAFRLERAYHHLRAGHFSRAWYMLTQGDRLKPGPPKSLKRMGADRSIRIESDLTLPKSLSRDKKTVAQNWLEMEFGWTPLLKDLEEGAELLAHISNVPVEQVYRVRSKKDHLPRDFSPLEVLGYSASTRVQLIAYVREIDVPQLVGLTDLASVAWEKTPWSFVADWVIPIGSYLSARGLAQALEAVYVRSHTVRVKCGNVQQAEPGRQPPLLPSGYRGGGGAFFGMDLTRTVTSSLDIPRPEVKPLLKAASWKHTVDALALLVQGVNKK